LHFGDRQTNKQTDSSHALSRSCYRKRRLNTGVRIGLLLRRHFSPGSLKQYINSKTHSNKRSVHYPEW